MVEIGSTIPIVYANRQMIGGIGYGGIRVNTNLLWSADLIASAVGSYCAPYSLSGEANVIASLDPTQFAIGNNVISGYDLERRNVGRICIYSALHGRRQFKK